VGTGIGLQVEEYDTPIRSGAQGVYHLQGHRQPACRPNSSRPSQNREYSAHLGIDVEDALELAECTEV
jgi:hypothetical protein